MSISVSRLAIALLLTLSLHSCSDAPEWHAGDITGMMPDLRFALTGPDGGVFEARSLLGKPVLVFFGFTSCPDVCPTTLTQLSVVIKKLGDQADDVQVVLKTADPELDTPTVMKNYTASFGPWLLGLTGPGAALAKLRETYGVYAAMESSPGKGINVMHSAAIFAFDAKGRARLLIRDVSDSDAVVADIQHLIEL